MWFDAWPLVMHLPHEERPLHMTFGDDGELTRDEIRQMVALYDRFGIKVDWRAGDVVVFDNFRFAHGRPGIEPGEGEEPARRDPRPALRPGWSACRQVVIGLDEAGVCP